MEPPGTLLGGAGLVVAIWAFDSAPADPIQSSRGGLWSGAVCGEAVCRIRVLGQEKTLLLEETQVSLCFSSSYSVLFQGRESIILISAPAKFSSLPFTAQLPWPCTGREPPTLLQE